MVYDEQYGIRQNKAPKFLNRTKTQQNRIRVKILLKFSTFTLKGYIFFQDGLLIFFILKFMHTVEKQSKMLQIKKEKKFSVFPIGSFLSKTYLTSFKFQLQHVLN